MECFQCSVIVYSVFILQPLLSPLRLPSSAYGFFCSLLLNFLTKLEGCPLQMNILERCLLMSQWKYLFMFVFFTVLFETPSLLRQVRGFLTENRSLFSPFCPKVLKLCDALLFLCSFCSGPAVMLSLKQRQRLFSLYLGGILISLLNVRLLMSARRVGEGPWRGRGERECCCMQKVKRPGQYLLSFQSRGESMLKLLQACYNLPYTDRMLELPFPKLHHKNKSSCCESTPAKHSFTSPLLDEYERVAANYKAYVNELAPKIEVVCKKENYRSYLKEQKLNMIKSQLITKKEVLQKQLEEKLDPTKSTNGKLHSEILSLTQLETNYCSILNHLHKSLSDKQQQISRVQQTLLQQKQIIKHLLKYDFKLTQQQASQRLPTIYRNASESSFLSRDSAKGTVKHSREEVMSKLSSSIISKTNARINSEEQKVIMLRLFMLYHSDSHQSSTCLIESLQKQLGARQQILKEIKKELAQIEQEGRASVHRD